MIRRLIAAAALACASAAQADTVTIEGTDAVYGAGLTGGIGVSTAPEVFSFTAGAGAYITASYISGLVGCCGVANDAGENGANGTNVSSLNGISGIIAPDQMFLVGVFVDSSDLPTSGDTAPAILNFNTIGTSFATLSPLLNQAFWIGDGLTGTGTGATQKFFAPTGADQLLLGFADSFSFSGAPSYYGDNPGALSFEINAATAPIPLPAGLPLLLTSLAGLTWLRRRSV